jgi:hypothetical protein
MAGDASTGASVCVGAGVGAAVAGTGSALARGGNRAGCAVGCSRWSGATPTNAAMIGGGDAGRGSAAGCASAGGAIAPFSGTCSWSSGQMRLGSTRTCPSGARAPRLSRKISSPRSGSPRSRALMPLSVSPGWTVYHQVPSGAFWTQLVGSGIRRVQPTKISPRRLKTRPSPCRLPWLASKMSSAPSADHRRNVRRVLRGCRRAARYRSPRGSHWTGQLVAADHRSRRPRFRHGLHPGVSSCHPRSRAAANPPAPA